MFLTRGLGFRISVFGVRLIGFRVVAKPGGHSASVLVPVARGQEGRGFGALGQGVYETMGAGLIGVSGRRASGLRMFWVRSRDQGLGFTWRFMGTDRWGYKWGNYGYNTS